MAAPNVMPSSSGPPESFAPPLESWKENLNLQVMCPDCKEVPPNLVEEFSSGDMVCDSCGLVLGDKIIDTRSEWRTFSNDDQGNDDPSRVGDGANPLLNGSQLSTSISFGDKGSNRSRDLYRAQNKSTHDKSTKTLLAAYKQIGALGDSMSIPLNVIDTAKHLFKKVNDAGAFKGKSQDAVISGCIFIACRQCNAGRTFREIYNVTKVPKAEIGRIFKKLQIFFAEENQRTRDAALQNGGTSLLNSSHTQGRVLILADIAQPTEELSSLSATDAKDLVIRFCSHLKLGKDVVRLSRELAGRLQDEGPLAGRSPLSVAAAVIYMAAAFLGTPRNAKDIAKATSVSDGTVRSSYKLIYPMKEDLIGPKWLEGRPRDALEKMPIN